jgi:CheY-like chemotaxis protein
MRDVALIRHHAEAGDNTWQIEHVTRVHEAGARLSSGSVDLVLLDLNLPDTSVDSLDAIRAIDRSVPIVVLTSVDDEMLAPALTTALRTTWSGRRRAVAVRPSDAVSDTACRRSCRSWRWSTNDRGTTGAGLSRWRGGSARRLTLRQGIVIAARMSTSQADQPKTHPR